jgi:hypothetical protein
MKISQAVGMGFLIMGAIGYFIKLSTSAPHSDPAQNALIWNSWLTVAIVHIPVNNVLVG